MNIKLFAETLRAGADAADRIDKCPKCDAMPGRPCVTTTKGDVWNGRHSGRLSGDATLAFTLRAMALYLEEMEDEL